MKKYLYIVVYCLICMQSTWAYDATVFPTLAGLSRTLFNENYSGDGDECGQNTTCLQQPNKEVTINDKQYLEFSVQGCKLYLYELNNRVYLYGGRHGAENVILYDYTLGVGDTLHKIRADIGSEYDKFVYADEFLTVTKVETITLLDGKKHKKWTFDNGMEYVESIGSFGTSAFAGDFFQLVEFPLPTCIKQCHCVCISRDGQLLYEMKQEEQEQLDTYCMSIPDKTAIHDTQVLLRSTTKLLKNGHILIDCNDKTYNIMGIEEM